MTQTIEELRAETWNLHTMRDATEFADKLLGLLEAERQRADDCDKSAKYSAATNKSVVAANCRLQEEIAALKGGQVPYGYVVRCHHEPAGTGTMIKANELDYYKYRGDYHYTELFTAPQKPVVNPDKKRMDWLCAHVVEVRQPLPYGSHAMFYGQCDSDDCEEYHSKLREQIDAAIEAAGGKVQS